MSSGIKVSIPFEDPSQHLYPATMEIADGAGRLADLQSSSELVYFNFDEDDSVRSKRGGKDIVLVGNNNDGEILDGWLQIGKVNSSYANLLDQDLDTPDILSARFDYRPTVVSFSGEREIIRFQNTSDSSRIRFYVIWQGSGIYRLYAQVTSATGANLYNPIVSTFTMANLETVSAAFSFDKSGMFRVFVNGALDGEINSSSWNINFSNVDVTFGGSVSYNKTCIVDLTNIQIVNDALWPTEAEVETGPVYSKSKTYQQMITVAPLLMDQFIALSALYRYLGSGDIRHTLMKNAEYIFFNASSGEFEVVKDAQTDHNSIDDLAANLDKLYLENGVGAYIQMVTLIKSADGYSTPEITHLDVEYKFYFSLGQQLPRCVVVGSVIDNQGQPATNIRLVVVAKDVFNNQTEISANSTYEVGENGKYSVAIVETESTETTVTIYIYHDDYDEEGNQITTKRVHKNLIIPNKTTEYLSQIILDSANG